MAENSAIEWTDHTFNPWIGCAKVSAGCKHCYAETLMETRYGRVKWGVNGTRVRTSPPNWKKPVRWNRDAEQAGTPAKVFCASLADVFEDRPEIEPWRADLFDLIEATPWLRWQLLTKRPENVVRMLPDRWDGVLPSNVWIGTSVEDQAAADERIPHLLQIPSAVRFLSCEPLLGEVQLRQNWRDFLEGWDTEAVPGWDGEPEPAQVQTERVHWVIIGGESGPGARPCDVAWIRDLVRQCREAGVATFVKQLGAVVQTRNDDGFDDDGCEGGWPSYPELEDLPGYPGWQGDPVRVQLRSSKGGDWSEWPADLRVREFPELAGVL